MPVKAALARLFLVAAAAGLLPEGRVAADPVPLVAGTFPKCGAPMATWSSRFGDITAYSNGRAGPSRSCGERASRSRQYQCVELVNRWLIANLGLEPHLIGGVGGGRGVAGPRMCAHYDGDDEVYRVYYPGKGRGKGKGAPEPVPGDILVWDGHAALVIASDADSVSFLEQNSVWPHGSARYTTENHVDWDGKTFGPHGKMAAACWIHPVKIGVKGAAKAA